MLVRQYGVHCDQRPLRFVHWHSYADDVHVHAMGWGGGGGGGGNEHSSTANAWRPPILLLQEWWARFPLKNSSTQPFLLVAGDHVMQMCCLGGSVSSMVQIAL